MVCKLKPPSRPIRTGLSHLVGLGKLHGHLGWNGTIAKNHGDTVGSSANTLRQTSTEGHIHTHACVHTIAHHYVDTNMNSTIWNIKHAISGSRGVLGGYNSEFMGVCVRRQCFCPSFWGVIRCIPQTSINMLAITPGSLGLWSAQNTNMNMCSLLPSFFLAKSPNCKGRLHHIPLLLVNSTTIVGIISTFVAHILIWYAAKTSNAWNHRVGNLDRLSKHPPTPCGKSKKYIEIHILPWWTWLSHFLEIFGNIPLPCCSSKALPSAAPSATHRTGSEWPARQFLPPGRRSEPHRQATNPWLHALWMSNPKRAYQIYQIYPKKHAGQLGSSYHIWMEDLEAWFETAKFLSVTLW